MPVYEYQGQHYELPDGLSKEQALSKIKVHVGGAEQKPKNTIGQDLWEGTKGAAAFAGDAASAMVKIPAQAALAIGGKIADPSNSLQDTWNTAGLAIEDTFPSLTKPMGVDPEKNRAYSAAMYPFQKYGEGVEWAAEKGSFGNKDVEGAINIFGNVAPIPFAKKGAKAAGSIMTRLDPTLYNIEVDAANAKTAKQRGSSIADAVAAEKAESAPKVTPDTDLGTQLALDRYNNDRQVERLQHALDKENKPLDPITVDQSGRAMLPDEIEAQRTFERGMTAEDAVARRQEQLEFDVARQTALDQGAASRARQEAAPTGYAEWQEGLRQSAEQRQPGNNEPINWPRKVADRYPDMTTSPMEGRPDYGSIAPDTFEKAALPIEIADSLRTGDIPADPFDRYSPQQKARRILEEGEPTWIEKGGIRRGRGPAKGVIDPDLLTFGVAGLMDSAKARGMDNVNGRVLAKFIGTFKEAELRKWAEQSRDPMSRTRLVWMTPDEFLRIAEERQNPYTAMSNEKRRNIKGALTTQEGLNDIPALFISAENGVWGHEGRHRMDIFKEQGIDKIPVRVETSIMRNNDLDTTQPIIGQNGTVHQFPELVFPNTVSPDPLRRGKGPAKGGVFWGKKPEDKATLPEPKDLKLSPKYPVRPESPSSDSTIKASNIIGLKNTPYDRVNTVEQVLQSPGKDLSGLLRGTKDALQSGLEGTLRHNTTNAGVNFARTVMQNARNKAEQLSKFYLTDTKTGLNAQLNKLSMREKSDVVSLMLELDKQEMPLTDSVMAKAGFTENQITVARKMRDANDALYAEKNAALGLQGFDPHSYRKGHMPGNFGGAYKTLIGYTDKDGNFHIQGVAQADTKAGHKAAVEWYRKQGNDKFKTEITLPRKGVGQRVYSSAYDGWADLVQEIAKHDPEFQKNLDVAAQRGKEAVASLYDFQVHEKAKKGIVGSYGNRPWLSKEQNTKEFLRGFIDYLEEGYKYTAYQDPLNQLMTLTRNPEYRASHPNTVNYLDKYVKHVTGNSLNPIGSAANWAIDRTAGAVGLGNSQFSRVHRELAQASTLHMMGVFNPGFFLAQLTQWATGGIPEAAAMRSTLNIDPVALTDSLSKTVMDAAALGIESNTGKPIKNIDPHIREAYKWGHDNGLFTFSEVALAHQVLQSKARRKIEPFIDWPIRLGEQATRPTVFLAFVDMFHKAGFRGEDAYLRAQTATDYAMVNYHPDERPMIYQSLGALGTSLGALTTYKHNLVSQIGSRVGDAAKGKNMAAAVAMLGVGYGLYGVLGLPGAQEASSMAETITGKPLREILLDNPKEPSAVMDGLLSAKTGLDFQSRLSMASVLPDSPMSSAPHISNFFNVMGKAYEAGMNWDKGSAQELAKAVAPAGLRGAVESQIYPDGNILDKTGKQKYDAPRTPEEEFMRNILGVRPFRERLQDENVWSSRVSEAKRADKMKKSLERFDRAFLLDDTDGMAKAEEDYTSADGDITTLYSSQRLRTLIENANKSEPDRRAGKPTRNTSSLKKFEAFTD
jgi:hypothetical protein